MNNFHLITVEKRLLRKVVYNATLDQYANFQNLVNDRIAYIYLYRCAGAIVSILKPNGQQLFTAMNVYFEKSKIFLLHSFRSV